MVKLHQCNSALGTELTNLRRDHIGTETGKHSILLFGHSLIQTQLIGSSTLSEVSVKYFPIISCLKCTVNSYFHYFEENPWL